MNKIILIILFSLLFFGCKLKIDAKINNSEKIISDQTETYTQICINNHVYYKFYDQLAIRLNDNGLPVRCIPLKKGAYR